MTIERQLFLHPIVLTGNLSRIDIINTRGNYPPMTTRLRIGVDFNTCDPDGAVWIPSAENDRAFRAGMPVTVFCVEPSDVFEFDGVLEPRSWGSPPNWYWVAIVDESTFRRCA
jgi:hypothetical protein